MRARDYDPSTGQFLTVDPAVDQTRQPYAYTGNNPLTRTDPTGLDFWEDAGRNFLAFWAGTSDGVGFNIPMLLDCTSYNKYKDNGFYWAGDAVGVLVAVATLTAAFDVRIGTALLTRPAATTAERVLTASEQRAVNSLQAQISAHTAKLAAYRADPYAYDNLKVLQNAASPQIAQSIISGRINHLQSEIRGFQNQIDQILGDS